MKIVIILLIVLGIMFFFGVLILAFIAGATATSSALDQVYEDMAQEEAIRQWFENHNAKQKKGDQIK